MMRQFDKVSATFAPQRTDDLREGVAEWIGRRLEWQAVWEIEGGQFDGEWAMQPLDGPLLRFPAAWVPLCDLQEIAPAYRQSPNTK